MKNINILLHLEALNVMFFGSLVFVDGWILCKMWSNFNATIPIWQILLMLYFTMPCLQIMFSLVKMILYSNSYMSSSREFNSSNETYCNLNYSISKIILNHYMKRIKITEITQDVNNEQYIFKYMISSKNISTVNMSF